jgi:hypothetical protein
VARRRTKWGTYCSTVGGQDHSQPEEGVRRVGRDNPVKGDLREDQKDEKRQPGPYRTLLEYNLYTMSQSQSLWKGREIRGPYFSFRRNDFRQPFLEGAHQVEEPNCELERQDETGARGGVRDMANGDWGKEGFDGGCGRGMCEERGDVSKSNHVAAVGGVRRS